MCYTLYIVLENKVGYTNPWVHQEAKQHHRVHKKEDHRHQGTQIGHQTDDSPCAHKGHLTGLPWTQQGYLLDQEGHLAPARLPHIGRGNMTWLRWTTHTQSHLHVCLVFLILLLSHKQVMCLLFLCVSMKCPTIRSHIDNHTTSLDEKVQGAYFECEVKRLWMGRINDFE